MRRDAAMPLSLPALRCAAARAGTVLALWRRRQSTRQALRDLPHHILEDIGVTEAEARREATRFFWQGR